MEHHLVILHRFSEFLPIQEIPFNKMEVGFSDMMEDKLSLPGREVIVNSYLSLLD